MSEAQPVSAAGPTSSDFNAGTTSTSTETVQVTPDLAESEDHIHTRDFGFLPIPERVRYDPKHPIHFGLVINIMLGFTSTFIVANLYYCQPLLIELAKSFDVTYDQVSIIPTLLQTGYAVGLLTISILGDLVRRRPLIMLLVFISGSLTIGLAVTNDLVAFEVISFLVGVSSVTPQILMPLAADLAPPERRASALSIVLAGLLLGVLLARVLAGVVAQFVTWRVIYYLAIGLQFLVLAVVYWLLPDYPAKNKGATYFGILASMAKFVVTEPLLLQAALINLPSSATFTNFWVTLTFLLGADPYNYSTLVIGLFGLVGMFGVAMAPLVGRVIDGLVPWFATFIAILFLLVFQAIQVGAGGVNIAAVVIVCFGLDVFRQMAQVSLTSAVFSIDANARARLNAVMLLSLFIGQVMGTSVGTKVFVQYGWRPAAALSLAWTGFMLFLLLLRGPHVPRHTWFGYAGGYEVRKKVLAERQRQQEEEAVTALDIERNCTDKEAECLHEKTTPECTSCNEMREGEAPVVQERSVQKVESVSEKDPLRLV
ncbi:major facilitator superfamily domain-containing protein [Amylocystis lapponica]|nr:major facilitator superfamily domain-containing protein [Amylocystis lapponica]